MVVLVVAVTSSLFDVNSSVTYLLTNFMIYDHISLRIRKGILQLRTARTTTSCTFNTRDTETN